MAEVMTYASLKEDMRRYLERGGTNDPTVQAQIPRLIGLAERAIANTLKIQGFIDVVTDDLTLGVSVYAKPDRWRQTISMSFGVGEGDAQERTPLFPRSYEYARSYWPAPGLRDVPQFYADYQYEHWLIVPTPIATYPWEVVYYQLPPLLSDENQTNWLTDFAPNALLYRAMMEASPFLKDDARLPVWQQMYMEALQGLTTQDLKKIVDRTSTRQEA